MAQQLLVVTAATAAQTLPKAVARVNSAYFLNGDATAGSPITGEALTPTSGAPSATEIQFTGKPSAPSATVTLSAAPVAGLLLVVDADVAGEVGAAA